MEHLKFGRRKDGHREVTPTEHYIKFGRSSPAPDTIRRPLFKIISITGFQRWDPVQEIYCTPLLASWL